MPATAPTSYCSLLTGSDSGCGVGMGRESEVDDSAHFPHYKQSDVLEAITVRLKPWLERLPTDGVTWTSSSTGGGLRVRLQWLLLNVASMALPPQCGIRARRWRHAQVRLRPCQPPNPVVLVKILVICCVDHRVWWNAKVRIRPSHPPAASPVSGLLDLVLTPGSGGGGGESVHKDGAPLRPIVSLKGTPTYGLAKWLIRRLKFLTAESDTTVSSSAQFLEKLKGPLFAIHAASPFHPIRALPFNLSVTASVIYPNYLTSDRHRLIMSSDSTSQPIAGMHTFDLPSVWLGDIALWLRTVESRFALRQITREDTKFHYVVAALPMDIATDLRDIIDCPPTEAPYTALKEALISLSTQKRLQRLISEEDLGDRKPTQLLRRLEQLADRQKLDASMSKQLFSNGCLLL
ncbi:hypothetical protein SprV_0802609000 [Sparganum proliferum]